MALREVLADLSVRVRGTRQLQGATRGVNAFVGNMRAASTALGAAGAAITSALAIGQVAAFTKELIDLGDELGKTAQQLGLTTDQLQAWRFAADRSGVDGRAMSQSFMRLQRAAFDASRGSRTQAEAFGALGVQLRDGNGQLLAADELMRQMARGMAGLEDETAKVALAQTLMGRSGARLLPLLNGGEEGAEALLERFRELGGGLSADFVVSAEAAQDAITDWNTATLSFKSQLGAAFLPTLTRVLLAVTEYGTLIASAVRRSNAVQVAFWGLVTVLGALAVAFAIGFAPVTVGLALLALLFFVVEDLVTLFMGGESAIGAFLDELFGVGTAQDVVESLTAAWEGLVSIIREAGELLGLVDEAGPGRLSPRAARRAREQAKVETTPDGSEARRPPAPRPPPPGNAFMQAFAIDPDSLRGNMTVPTGRMGGASRTDVSQRVDVGRIDVRVDGAGDPERAANLAGERTADALQRVFGNAAAELPQGRG